MESPLSASDLAPRLEARVQRRLSPLLGALALGFALFALVTLVFRPAGATVALAILDTGGALIMGAGAVLLHRGTFRGRRANAIAGAALLLAIGASFAAVKLLHLPSQFTNVILVELVGSVLLLSVPWTLALVAASLAGWAAIAGSEGWGPAWLNAGFAVGVTSIMAVTMQIVRLREARVTEQLAAANEEKAARLERLVATEQEHARSLQASNQSLEAFAYIIAHDLKEPIRATEVHIEEARGLPDRAGREAALERALASQRQLQHLVEGLLAWGRATTTPLEAEAVDLHRLLEDPMTRQLFEHARAERRARVLIDPALPAVMGTPALLRQVLGNLILNGIRHNPSPEPQVRVRAVPEAPPGRIDLVVEDNGPGIPDAVLARLRGDVHRPRTVRGGFGLAIARRAMERLGGDLVFENAPAGGARVHLILARAAPSPRPDRS